MSFLYYLGVILLLILNLNININGDPLPYDGVVRYNDNIGIYVSYMEAESHTNHASFLEELPDGSLIMAWFSGEHEAANNTAILFSKLMINDSTKWTKPKIISQRINYSNQNPVLFYDKLTNILHCFHSQEPAQNQSSMYNESKAQIWHLQSINYGDTWSESKVLFNENGAFTRNRIIESLNNGLLFPIYNASTSFYVGYPLIAICNKNNRYNLGDRDSWNLTIINHSNDHLVQPSIFLMPLTNPATFKAYLRDRNEIAIYESISSDNGATWSIPSSIYLPNPNVAIQANILNNSMIALVFNDYNGNNKLGRTPLSIGLSYDDGKHFPIIKMLQIHNDNETFINGSCSYSYPSILQTNDGWIHCCYTYDSRYSTQTTIKYIRFNYSWLLYG